MVRRKLHAKQKLFWFFKRAEKRVLVKELLHGMKDAYLNTKSHKQQFITKYINHCAGMIQKAYRGHIARKGQ